MSASAPLRQPIPLARSILWAPGSGSPRRPDSIPFPIFLAQAALTAIHEHVANPPPAGQGILGFLLGDLCECPDSGVSYVVIDAALRLNQAIYGDRSRDVVTRLRDRLQAQLAQQKARLIGWYHTHLPLPLTLSERDVETHEHHFAEPWQVAMLLGTDAAEPVGAFFRAGSDAWASTPLPFYELLKEESLRPGGKKRSFVTWRNYRAYKPVAPQTPTASSAAAAPPVAPGPPAPPAPPVPPAPKPPGEPKAARAAKPAPPPEPELEPEAESEPEPELEPEPPPPALARPAPPPPPPPPPPPAPAPAPPSLAEAPPQPPVAKREERTSELRFLTTADDFATPRELPTGAAPPPPPPPRAAQPQPRATPAPAPLASSELEPLPPPSPPEAAPFEPAAGETPAWAAEPEASEEPVPAAELEEAAAIPRRRKRRAGLWPALLVLVIVAAVGGAYWWFQPVIASWVRPAQPAPAQPPPQASAVPRRQPQRPPPQAAPAPVPAPAVALPPAAPSPFAQLDQIGDSLTRVVREFATRAQLFERRVFDCPELARALAPVEQRWSAYSTARRAAGVLDRAHAARVQTLYAGVDSVERRFEQSGCARP